VGYRADLWNLRKTYNLSCHTSLRKEMTKQLPLEDRRRKNIKQTLPNHLARI
jgi:hypothetical protein